MPEITLNAGSMVVGNMVKFSTVVEATEQNQILTALVNLPEDYIPTGAGFQWFITDENIQSDFQLIHSSPTGIRAWEVKGIASDIGELSVIVIGLQGFKYNGYQDGTPSS